MQLRPAVAAADDVPAVAHRQGREGQTHTPTSPAELHTARHPPAGREGEGHAAAHGELQAVAHGERALHAQPPEAHAGREGLRHHHAVGRAPHPELAPAHAAVAQPHGVRAPTDDDLVANRNNDGHAVDAEREALGGRAPGEQAPVPLPQLFGSMAAAKCIVREAERFASPPLAHLVVEAGDEASPRRGLAPGSVVCIQELLELVHRARRLEALGLAGGVAQETKDDGSVLVGPDAGELRADLGEEQAGARRQRAGTGERNGRAPPLDVGFPVELMRGGHELARLGVPSEALAGVGRRVPKGHQEARGVFVFARLEVVTHGLLQVPIGLGGAPAAAGGRDGEEGTQETGAPTHAAERTSPPLTAVGGPPTLFSARPRLGRGWREAYAAPSKGTMANSNRLGELLVRQRLISLAQLRHAQEEQQKSGHNLGYTLAKLGYVRDDEITSFLSQQYRVPAVNLEEYEIDGEVLKLVSKEHAEKHKVLPLSRTGNSLVVAMTDPTNLHAIDDLKFLTGYNIEPVIASETAIQGAIERYYNAGPSYDEVMAGFDEGEIEFTGEEAELDAGALERASEDAPVVRLCNMILLNAIKKKASDIHIEPYEKRYRVRYRVDGILLEEMAPPLKLKDAIASRIKIMASLDIAERRLPQDGRIKLKLGKGREMDFRVSVCPTIWGEKIVLRLLDKSNLQLDMTKLGFDARPLEDFKWAIHQPWGMVLVTGPTGSGKTTTLYSALAEMNQPGHNISTAEDPVEYNLMGINQVQMKDDIGLNFAAALRSFLRQDPDCIMVGEIRDFETAEIAVKAALTGHMVLSTLHTNDAPATVSRLLNMGVEPFLITASLNLILAQRLARKICPDCKQPHKWDVKVLRDLGATEEQIAGVASGQYVTMKGGGVPCKTCDGKGYRGRVALYEVMRFNDEVREMILQGGSTAELKACAIKNGMSTLRMSGIRKILDGVTTPEEVTRVTMAD